MLADWVNAGEQPLDLWTVDIRRFSNRAQGSRLDARPHARGLRQALHRCVSARRIRERPAAHRLAALSTAEKAPRRLRHRNSAGSAPTGSHRKASSRATSIPSAAATGSITSARSTRPRANGLRSFDQSSFAKFEMRGRDAEKALSWIAANDVTKPPGRLVYTQMLNSRGGIECDLTVARLAADHFYIVTGTGFRTHDFAWIRQNIPA